MDIKKNKLGARIPGIEGLLSGLLFADDLVVIAESKDYLRKILDLLTKWADKWQMTYGIKLDGSKTAVMGFGSYASQILKTGNRLKIQKSEVPIINEYTYLGGEVNNKLDKKKVVQTQGIKLSKNINKYTKTLRCKTIPANLRANILLTRIYPGPLYSSTYTGMQEDHYDPLQTIANSAIRSIVTGSRFGKEWTPLAPISIEKT
eukprot:Lithocolla_globosa_v1_NODE_1574_length_2483_cov_6.390083.p1 type:complete len:204 gc:universal NODE_1574_length_2483_cov_6.390083:1776-1165(-)